MSNEKLEALTWRRQTTGSAQGIACGGRWMRILESEDHVTEIAMNINKCIRAAHALGVAEGKREAYAIAAKLAEELTAAKLELERLREAAPVDDGRKFEIWYRPFPNNARVRVGIYKHETFSETCADAICQATNPTGELIYEARPVEPKHVHTWSDAEPNGTRICLHLDCNSRQVAEWKDEP